MSSLFSIITLLLNLLIVLIFIRAILSWFMQVGGDPITRLLLTVTEPILRPIRDIMNRLVPGIFIDVSPIIAIVALQLISGLFRTASGY
ncbi:MAG: YggT family protein [Chloroflexia bacterium]